MKNQNKHSTSSAKAPAREPDPYYDGEKLYAIGGGRYIQYDGQGALPEPVETFVQRTGRKPPFMLLPETPVDFHLSKGFGGATSKIHWPGKGPLPQIVLAYLNDHGALPRTREILDENLAEEEAEEDEVLEVED